MPEVVEITSREYFEAARAAQRLIDGRLTALRSMRAREGVRGQTYEAIGRGTGASDPTRATDERIDAESRIRAELGALEREVEDARAVCRGIRAANPSHPLWGDAIELHYVELMGWAEIGRYLGCTGEAVRRAAYAALDWVDMVGIAAAREGCGQAALF
jgi:hypothetical protein